MMQQNLQLPHLSLQCFINPCLQAIAPSSFPRLTEATQPVLRIGKRLLSLLQGAAVPRCNTAAHFVGNSMPLPSRRGHPTAHSVSRCPCSTCSPGSGLCFALVADSVERHHLRRLKWGEELRTLLGGDVLVFKDAASRPIERGEAWRSHSFCMTLD